MADYRLMSQYHQQVIVRDRNLGGLVAWAGYTAELEIPATKPAEDWVRARIVAEQIPLNAMVYVDRTMMFFAQDPAIITNVREHMSQWNSTDQEVALSAQVQSTIDAFMPRFAAKDVSDQQVQEWYDSNGFGAAAE